MEGYGGFGDVFDGLQMDDEIDLILWEIVNSFINV